MQASLLAFRGDRGALDWLDKALQRGWLDQYYSADLNGLAAVRRLRQRSALFRPTAAPVEQVAQQRAQVLAQWH